MYQCDHEILYGDVLLNIRQSTQATSIMRNVNNCTLPFARGIHSVILCTIWPLMSHIRVSSTPLNDEMKQAHQSRYSPPNPSHHQDLLISYAYLPRYYLPNTIISSHHHNSQNKKNTNTSDKAGQPSGLGGHVRAHVGLCYELPFLPPGRGKGVRISRRVAN